MKSNLWRYAYGLGLFFFGIALFTPLSVHRWMDSGPDEMTGLDFVLMTFTMPFLFPVHSVAILIVVFSLVFVLPISSHRLQELRMKSAICTGIVWLNPRIIFYNEALPGYSVWAASLTLITLGMWLEQWGIGKPTKAEKARRYYPG